MSSIETRLRNNHHLIASLEKCEKLKIFFKTKRIGTRKNFCGQFAEIDGFFYEGKKLLSEWIYWIDSILRLAKPSSIQTNKEQNLDIMFK